MKLILLAWLLAATGWATWYDNGPGIYGAAGPALRQALGPDWRGQRVTVCAASCVAVTLTDWCQCGSRNGTPTVIDLSRDAFAQLAPLSRGVIAVTVEGLPSAPPTDIEVTP